MRSAELRNIIAQIEQWLRTSGTPEYRLGLLAAGNPHAVGRIRNSTASIRTLDPVLAFVTTNGAGSKNSRPPPVVNRPSPSQAPLSVDYRARLITVREALGYSQRQMAEQILTPFDTYRQWESGRFRTPAVAVIAAEMHANQKGIKIPLGTSSPKAKK